MVEISGEISINTVVGTGNTGRLVGNTKTYWGSHGFSVALDLNGNTLEVNSGGGNEPFGASGALSGSGAVIFDTVWDHKISVSGSNTYSGTTLVRRGWVQLANPAGQTALLGPVTVGQSAKAKLVWSASDQIDDTADVSLAITGSLLDLAGASERFDDLTMAAGTLVETGAGGVLNVKTLTVNGVVKPKGTYIAGSGFVTGSGYIDVDDNGPPVIQDPPVPPASPSPGNSLTTVHPATFVKLDWADSSGATSYDVYRWSATDVKPAAPTGNVGVSEYTPGGGVLSLTTYHWQVVAKNTVGDTPGPEWNFTTVARWDISGTIDNPTTWIGAGNTANLIGNATFGWQTSTCLIPATLNAFTLSLNSGGGNFYNYKGSVAGAGGLNIQGVGYTSNNWNTLMKIGGGAGNNYTGPTLALPGTVSLEKTSGNALCGAVTVGSHGDTARLVWMADHQISDASDVSLLFFDVGTGAYAGRGTWLDLNGHADTIHDLNLESGILVKTGAGGVLTTHALTLDDVVMGSGTYTAASHDFITGTGSVVVSTGASSAFDFWATGAKGLSGLSAAFDGDPDKDRIPNGIEFVIGGEPNPANPDSDSSARLPSAACVGENFVFTFTRMHEAAYLNPVVELNDDLSGAWTPALDPGNATIDVTPGEVSDTVTVMIPRGVSPNLFVRLRVGESILPGGIVPRITTSPVGATVVSGEDFTLTASAGGAQQVAWQWYLDGSAIAGATNASYTVTGAISQHQGDYHVVASNALGSSTSAVAHIAITGAPGEAGLNLIPWPLNVLPGEGDLTIVAGARIVATDGSLLDAANVLSAEIAAAHARTLPVVTTAAADGDIVLELDAALTGERHSLVVDTRATVRGRNAFGVSLGTATLLQALRIETGALVCPRVTVDDEPAVAIRALHLDVARQDHSVESLLQAVDLCRLYKVNYLHIHFNDDQAYSFPSAAFPLLNTVTAGRNRKVYTLAEMQQLEAYSVARGVHIMPELEGPGHNALMLAAYPALFKITYPHDPNSTDPSYPKYEPSSSINVAKAEVRAAVRTLIGEMCAVFQSTPYFHLGCDEVDWAWSEYSADFQAVFAEWGFNRANPRDNVHLVFSKFITLARDYAAEFGKQSIVWENGAVTGSPEVPAPTDVLVMPFDSYNPGGFVSAGFKLVNAAWSPLYLVGHIRKPVSSVYAWDRTIFGQYSGENDEYFSHVVAAQHVTGTQLTTFEQEEDMEMMSTRLRLAAMNERTWNPGLGASYANFRERLAHTDALLDSLLSPVRISYAGLDNPDDRVFGTNATVSMSLMPGSAGQPLTIRYTTNRTDVTNASTPYTAPFQVTANGYLRAAAFNASGQRVGRMVRELHRHEMSMVANLAAGKPVTISTGSSAAKAVDLRDSEGWNTNVSATRPAGETLTVDLQGVESLDRIALLFAPIGTYFYRLEISLDAAAWNTVADTSVSGIAGTRAGVTHSFPAAPARYVRITLLPHTGGNGDKSVREIMVTGNG